MTEHAFLTRGAVALAAWFTEHPEATQAQLAASVGVTQGAVSAWLRGAGRPAAHTRVAVEIATGVDADEWMTDAEVEELRSVTPICHGHGAEHGDHE